jgi:plastocyanin domain-containing protein
MRAVTAALALALAFTGCKKASEEKAADQRSAPGASVPKAEGPRKVAIEAGEEGYVPDKISAKPNEKLMLVFTRTVDAECLAQVKTPDGTLHELPMNTPVEVAFTMPKEGKVTFACGMDMFTGTIVADAN